MRKHTVSNMWSETFLVLLCFLFPACDAWMGPVITDIAPEQLRTMPKTWFSYVHKALQGIMRKHFLKQSFVADFTQKLKQVTFSSHVCLMFASARIEKIISNHSAADLLTRVSGEWFMISQPALVPCNSDLPACSNIWLAILHRHLRLNVTFRHLYLSSKQLDRDFCNRGSFHIGEMSRKSHFSFCGWHSLFVLFPSLSHVLFFLCKDDFALFYMTILVSVIDVNVIKNNQINSTPKTFLKFNYLFQQSKRSLFIYHIQVSHFSTIRFVHFPVRVLDWAVFDGPGPQSKLITANPGRVVTSSGRVVTSSGRVVTSSFQCVLHTLTNSSNHSSLLTFESKVLKPHFSVQVAHDETKEFVIPSKDCPVIMCQMKFTTAGPGHIELTLKRLVFTGGGSAGCLHKGFVTADVVGGRTVPRGVECEYHALSVYNKMFQSLLSTMLCATYSYPEYTHLSVSVSVSVTMCDVLKIDVCETDLLPLDKHQPFLQLFKHANHTVLQNRIILARRFVNFDLQTNSCAVFKFSTPLKWKRHPGVSKKYPFCSIEMYQKETMMSGLGINLDFTYIAPRLPFADEHCRFRGLKHMGSPEHCCRYGWTGGVDCGECRPSGHSVHSKQYKVTSYKRSPIISHFYGFDLAISLHTPDTYTQVIVEKVQKTLGQSSQIFAETYSLEHVISTLPLSVLEQAYSSFEIGTLKFTQDLQIAHTNRATTPSVLITVYTGSFASRDIPSEHLSLSFLHWLEDNTYTTTHSRRKPLSRDVLVSCDQHVLYHFSLLPNTHRYSAFPLLSSKWYLHMKANSTSPGTLAIQWIKRVYHLYKSFGDLEATQCACALTEFALCANFSFLRPGTGRRQTYSLAVRRVDFSRAPRFHAPRRLFALSWAGAAALCRGLGASLPVFRDEAELDEFMALLKLSRHIPLMNYVYVGLKTSSHKGQVRTILFEGVDQHFLE